MNLPPEIEARMSELADVYAYKNRRIDGNRGIYFKDGFRAAWSLLTEMPKIPTTGYEKKMAKEIVRLREALEFYAGMKGYNYINPKRDESLDENDGYEAREALNHNEGDV